MASNVLPDSVIVGLVLAGLQLLKSLVPQTAAWPNNVIRAIGFVGCYAMVIVNTLVTGPLTWQGAWGLLPLAGALTGSATLLYHLATDSAPAGASAEASAPADSQDRDQGRRLLAVPAEAQVSVIVPPRAAPSASGAVPVPPPAGPTITPASSTPIATGADRGAPPPPSTTPG